MKLTPHEEKILELVHRHPEIVEDADARKKIAKDQGLSEKTLRNRIADLKKYGALEKRHDESLQPSSEFALFNIFDVVWAAKKQIIRNVIIISILSVILSLIMPLTYRSKAVIMPPLSDSSINIASALSALPLGGLLGGNGNTQSNTFVVILNSRKVREAIIRDFDLMSYYDVKYMDDALKELDKNTSVNLDDEGTITIAVMVTTPWFHAKAEIEKSKNLAKNITESYITKLEQVNKSLKSEKARNHREFIERRYLLNQVDLRNAENKLNEFQKTYNTVALPEQTTAAINIAASLKAQILANNVKLEILKQSLPAKHPDIINLTKENHKLQAQLTDMDKGLDQDFLLPKFNKISDLGIDLARLMRSVEVQNQLFVFLTQQFEEAKIQEAKDTPTLQVLDKASSPEKKYKPSRAKICIIGFLLSFILSMYYYYFQKRWIRYSRLKNSSNA